MRISKQSEPISGAPEVTFCTFLPLSPLRDVRSPDPPHQQLNDERKNRFFFCEMLNQRTLFAMFKENPVSSPISQECSLLNTCPVVPAVALPLGVIIMSSPCCYTEAFTSMNELVQSWLEGYQQNHSAYCSPRHIYTDTDMRN